MYRWWRAYYDWSGGVVSNAKVLAGCAAIVGCRDSKAICALLEVADIGRESTVSQAKIAVGLAIYSKSNLAYCANVRHVGLDSCAIAVGRAAVVGRRLQGNSWLLARQAIIN